MMGSDIDPDRLEVVDVVRHRTKIEESEPNMSRPGRAGHRAGQAQRNQFTQKPAWITESDQQPQRHKRQKVALPERKPVQKSRFDRPLKSPRQVRSTKGGTDEKTADSFTAQLQAPSGHHRSCPGCSGDSCEYQPDRPSPRAGSSLSQSLRQRAFKESVAGHQNSVVQAECVFLCPSINDFNSFADIVHSPARAFFTISKSSR